MTMDEWYVKMEDGFYGGPFTPQVPTLSEEHLQQYWRVPAEYVSGLEKWSFGVYPEPNDPEALARYFRRRDLAQSKGKPKSNRARRKLRNWQRKYTPPTHFYYMRGEVLDRGPSWGLGPSYTAQERIAVSTPIDFTPPKEEPLFGTDRTVVSSRLKGCYA